MNPSVSDALQLRDIHLPGTPSIWPPAPGWWLAAVIVLGLSIWISMMLWRGLKIRRQRKYIFGLLEQLEHSSGDTGTAEYLAQLSRLLRQLALTYFPTQQTASLTGNDWLKFLDESGGNGQFYTGPGRVLADGPYVRNVPETVDVHVLTTLVRDWVRKNAGVKNEF